MNRSLSRLALKWSVSGCNESASETSSADFKGGSLALHFLSL